MWHLTCDTWHMTAVIWQVTLYKRPVKGTGNRIYFFYLMIFFVFFSLSPLKFFMHGIQICRICWALHWGVLVVTYSHFPTVLLSNELTLTLSTYIWTKFFFMGTLKVLRTRQQLWPDIIYNYFWKNSILRFGRKMFPTIQANNVDAF